MTSGLAVRVTLTKHFANKPFQFDLARIKTKAIAYFLMRYLKGRMLYYINIHIIKQYQFNRCPTAGHRRLLK